LDHETAESANAQNDAPPPVILDVQLVIMLQMKEYCCDLVDFCALETKMLGEIALYWLPMLVTTRWPIVNYSLVALQCSHSENPGGRRYARP